MGGCVTGQQKTVSKDKLLRKASSVFVLISNGKNKITETEI